MSVVNRHFRFYADPMEHQSVLVRQMGTVVMDAAVDAVVIGRNEGARLKACLRSLTGQVRHIVYVDSGSSDGSSEAAASLGAKVVALDVSQPFSAARARNAGLAILAHMPEPAGFVQFVDGDCTVDADWIAAAVRAFAANPRAVVICGRRRERHPETSLWNRLCDWEWNTPIGQARACGGDALMRLQAILAVGGYRDDLIAGEEPELCLRLSHAGGQVWRIDAEMTLHDAAMVRFRQWWQRMRRAGHAFAEGAALHGAAPDFHWVRETRRAVIWGVGVPVLAASAAVMHPFGLALLLAWPLQTLRLGWRWRHEGVFGWQVAFFTVLGRLPEAQGVVTYWINRIGRRRAALIEYK